MVLFETLLVRFLKFIGIDLSVEAMVFIQGTRQGSSPGVYGAPLRYTLGRVQVFGNVMDVGLPESSDRNTLGASLASGGVSSSNTYAQKIPQQDLSSAIQGEYTPSIVQQVVFDQAMLPLNGLVRKTPQRRELSNIVCCHRY